MHRKIPSIVKHLLLWTLGFVLLWAAFKNQDFTTLWEQLAQIRWQWAIIILMVTVLNHLSRAKRWQLLLLPLEGNPRLSQSFLALMFGYLVSYAIPRLGEISRCVALRDQTQISFQKSLGTVFTERLIDILCLGVVISLAFWIEFSVFSTFFIHQIFQPILGRFTILDTWVLFYLILGFILLSGLAFVLFHFVKKKYQAKLIAFFKEMAQGVVSVLAIKHKLYFLFHTLFIWCTYFLMTYLWFDAFAATEHLSLAAGLTMMAIGSLGRLVPIQGGGMGAYHFLFQQGLLLYGVEEMYGFALAVVIHGFQTVYYLIVGGCCTLILAYRKSKQSV